MSATPMRTSTAALLGLATAALMVLSLPGPDQWYLSFVALVPMLVVIQRATARAAKLAAWLAGLGFFLAGLYWIWQLTIVGLIALALYLSLSFLVFAWAVRFLTTGRPRLPFLVAAPLAWVAIEYLRGLPLGGFYWHCLGHNLYRQTDFIQVADFSGVLGVSLVVVSVNAFLARGLYLKLWGDLRGPFTKRNIPLAGAAVLLLVGAAVGYGRFRIAETKPVAGPVITVLQGNFPEDLAEIAAAQQWTKDQFLAKREAMFATYREMTLREAASGRADLVVWPETAVAPLEGENYRDGDCSPITRAQVRRVSAELARPMLVGSTRLVVDDDPDNALRVRVRSWNGAYFLPSDNAAFQSYFKIHLVPFGEFIPFKELRPVKAVVEWFMPPGYAANLTAGENITLFRVRGIPFAAPICYEDTNPALAREFRRRGARFLVNITNDGWFRRSFELDQHLANGVFRTVENRVGLVVAANTGISAFVTPLGVVAARVEDAKGNFREVRGALTSQVLLDNRETLYTLLGDWPAWSAVTLGLLIALGRLLLRTKPATS